MGITVSQIKEMKREGRRITMLTAYDYTMARLLDESGVDMLLVGDSLGMVVLGYDSTLPVTLEVMIHHTRAVSRGAKKALVVGDLPFLTYHASIEEAIHNAGRFLQEGGAQAVKVEGGVHIAPTVKAIVNCGIPVMGHIGLTPQSINQLGGFKVQGKTDQAAAGLIADAKALEEAGAFAIVLECIPAPLSKLITERVNVATIGIGAGVHCDGQVQVIHDVLGLFPDFVPRHARQYARLGDEVRAVAKQYIEDVRNSSFPTMKESFAMDETLLSDI
jgi:3-methyl-2-oxobutanoate hydroxymethyltransferase